MKRFVTLLIFYFSIIFCNAQVAPDSSYVIVDTIKEESILLSKTEIFIDHSSLLPISAAIEKPFTPLANFAARKHIPPGLIKSTFYLKIKLRNSSEKEISTFLSSGNYFIRNDIYKINGQTKKLIDTDPIDGYKKIDLAAGEGCILLIVLKPLKNDFNYINPVLFSAGYIQKYKQYVVSHKSDNQIYGLILSGVLLMMILFMVTNFIISKKREFLYNAIYSLCMFLLMFLNSVLSRTRSDFTNLYYSYIDFFLLVIGTIFYITFTRKFLNTRNNYELLDRILKYSEQFVFILLGVYTYLNFFTPSYLPQFYLENCMKIFILTIGLAFIYLAFKRRDRLFNYIAAGNTMLVLFSTISLILILLNIKQSRLLLSSLFYYNTGIVFELAFFLLGLTYKNRLQLIGSIQKQESLKLEAEKKEYETQIAVMKAQQEERNRISADMHDDLGSGMTTIRLYSELAKTKLADKSIPEIEKISSSANELLNKMNAIIWSMSSSNDSLANMIAYIRSYALEYFEDTNIICKTEVPDNLPNLQVIGEIRRNVFLVVKEALNNILKHAKATEVNITLIRVEDGLTLYIQDNGIGINLKTLRQFGNGLKNMKKRMNDLDIEFNIENNEGTLITLHRKVKTF